MSDRLIAALLAAETEEAAAGVPPEMVSTAVPFGAFIDWAASARLLTPEEAAAYRLLKGAQERIRESLNSNPIWEEYF